MNTSIETFKISLTPEQQKQFMAIIQNYESDLKMVYDDGYNDGYDDGIFAGYGDGYDDGSAVGYRRGHDAGYDDGYEDGCL